MHWLNNYGRIHTPESTLMNIARPGNQVYNQNNVRCVINWTKLLIVFTRSSER